MMPPRHCVPVLSAGMAITTTRSNSTAAGPYEDFSIPNTMLALDVASEPEDRRFVNWTDDGLGTAVNDGGKNVSPYRVRHRRRKNKAARQARRRNRKNK